MKNPKKYINRQVYYDSGSGAIFGKIISEIKETGNSYYFVSERGDKMPISFSGKHKVIIKDGILERKLK